MVTQTVWTFSLFQSCWGLYLETVLLGGNIATKAFHHIFELDLLRNLDSSVSCIHIQINAMELRIERHRQDLDEHIVLESSWSSVEVAALSSL